VRDIVSALEDEPVTPSLDPTDWPEYRRQAHALLDSLLDHIQEADQRPVWQPVPEPIKQRLTQPSPAEPTELSVLRREIAEMILPYGTGNTHPRFWGWVHGTGTAGGMLAEMTAAALNANCGGRDHVAIYLERAVIDWARSWFGLPPTAGGILLSGTSMANLLGLAVARHHRLGGVRQDGLGGRRLTGYTSAEVHISLAKAFEVLGFGHAALRSVPVDTDYRIDPAALEQAITADRAAGFEPFCVIASAGTVNTGAIDDLTAVAAICRAQGLWFHVDGAFGALAALAPELAPRLAGLEQADSVAFDFHKWLHVPYDAGCLLVRDAALLRATFGGRPHYLVTVDDGLAGGDPWPCDLGFELSRGFRALKVWFTVREHGTARLGEAIARNCVQARALAEAIRTRSRLDLMAPVGLNIVCCRYRAPGLDDEALDRLNAALVTRMQLSGLVVTSTCRLRGRLAIRVCITNHRSQDSDFALLVDTIERTGAALVAEGYQRTPGNRLCRESG
jgi:glutamate/tyrosine decarboxylase-like PLP-dependent enzyme